MSDNNPLSPPPFDVRAAARALRKATVPRKRFQRGWVEPTGTREKTWTGFWYVYELIGGEQKRKQKCRVLGLRSDMTKGEAKAELDKLISQTTGQTTKRFQFMITVDECWKRYDRTMNRGWSDAQKLVIKAVWAKIEPSWGRKNPNEIDRMELQDWLDSLDLSESYLKKIKTYFSAVLDMAKEDGIIERNPASTLQMPDLEKSAKVFYTIAQLRILISTAEGRERIVVQLLIICGLRPSEMFALRWSDWSGDYMMVDEAYTKGKIKTTKTESSKAKVSVPPRLQRDLQEYWISCGRPSPDSWIFPSTVTDRPLDLDRYRNDHLKPLGRKAGLGEIDFRALRRSCATHLHNLGGEKAAQGQLRHADPDTTLRVYVQTIPEEVRKAACALEDSVYPE